MPWTKVYPDRTEFEKACRLEGRTLRGLTYREAIKETLTQVLQEDEKVFR